MICRRKSRAVEQQGLRFVYNIMIAIYTSLDPQMLCGRCVVFVGVQTLLESLLLKV